MGKEFACNAGDAGDAEDTGFIPGPWRTPRDGNGNPLQYSCLKKSHEQRSLAGYRPLGYKESNTNEALTNAMKHFFHWMLTLLLYDIATPPIEIWSLFPFFLVWASLWLALINRIWQGHEPIPTPSQSFKRLCAFWFFLLNVAEPLSKDPDSLLEEERPREDHESSQLRPSYISQPPPAQQLSTLSQEQNSHAEIPTRLQPAELWAKWISWVTKFGGGLLCNKS